MERAPEEIKTKMYYNDFHFQLYDSDSKNRLDEFKEREISHAVLDAIKNIGHDIVKIEFSTWTERGKDLGLEEANNPTIYSISMTAWAKERTNKRTNELTK